MAYPCFFVLDLFGKCQRTLKTEYQAGLNEIGEVCMAKKKFNEIREFNVNWTDDWDMVSVTMYEKKYMNQINKLAEKHPDEIRIVAENKDGIMVAHLPKKFVHVSFSERTKREMNEDQRAAAAERLKVARQKKAEMNE